MKQFQKMMKKAVERIRKQGGKLEKGSTARHRPLAVVPVRGE
ncbi:hypothetical protein ACO0LO_24350 [Undibacterium sp. TJN25]